MQKMKEYTIKVEPYAVQYGSLNIPEELVTDEEINNYIDEHFDDIKFGEPELDYLGIDFEWCCDDGNE